MAFLRQHGLLLLIVGTLYLGWYRWPGWYLAGMFTVLPITVGVERHWAQLLTFIIANPGKPLRELARDISFIAIVQLVALVYGSITLWHGRPLYYAYSGTRVVDCATDNMDPAESHWGGKRTLTWHRTGIACRAGSMRPTCLPALPGLLPMQPRCRAISNPGQMACPNCAGTEASGRLALLLLGEKNSLKERMQEQGFGWTRCDHAHDGSRRPAIGGV